MPRTLQILLVFLVPILTLFLITVLFLMISTPTDAPRWRASFAVPDVILDIPVISACETPRYTAAFPDCPMGGCREDYTIRYGTTVSVQEVERSMSAYLASRLPEYELQVIGDTGAVSSECQPVRIHAWRELEGS